MSCRLIEHMGITITMTNNQSWGHENSEKWCQQTTPVLSNMTLDFLCETSLRRAFYRINI